MTKEQAEQIANLDEKMKTMTDTELNSEFTFYDSMSILLNVEIERRKRGQDR